MVIDFPEEKHQEIKDKTNEHWIIMCDKCKKILDEDYVKELVESIRKQDKVEKCKQ